MTESTERVGAHDLHPNFNLKNAHRLIAALRNAAPMDIARERPLEINGFPAARRDVLHLPVDPASGDRRDQGRVPVAYNQGAWSCMVLTKSWTPDSCGTAACIAGFAWLMRESDKGEDVSADRFVTELSARAGGYSCMDALKDFLGISLHAASLMSDTTPCSLLDSPLDRRSVQPRHAVAMLEGFIEAGRVDWVRALGLVEVKKAKRDWRGLRPWRKRRWTEWLPTEEERGKVAEDRRNLHCAKVDLAERRGERGCRP